jgi:hypothetical protein
MSEFPTQKITIYHKEQTEYKRYVVTASIRHTYILNHNKNGNTSIDSVLIRIFDIDNVNVEYLIAKGDIVVDCEVKDIINGNTPQAQLEKIYGKESVFKVNSAEYFKFDDEDIKDLFHMKVGCV